jgi:membrane-associated phospholipid phosphatase
MSDGKLVIPSDYFAAHALPAVDLLTALFYLCWIPVPLGFAGYLFVVDKRTFLHYSLAFFVINLVGFVVYYTHPAAAPWYVERYGFAFDPTVHSDAAGLLRADRILGFGLFEGIYAKGSNVFAAMPSLHSAYPLAGVYYSLRQPRRWITVGFVIVTVGIWFSAVYLSHHYILDVLAGIACGITGIIICEKLIFSNPRIRRWLNAWENLLHKNHAAESG